MRSISKKEVKLIEAIIDENPGIAMTQVVRYINRRPEDVQWVLDFLTGVLPIYDEVSGGGSHRRICVYLDKDRINAFHKIQDEYYSGEMQWAG